MPNRLVGEFRSRVNRTASLVQAKSLAWRIFDTTCTLMGVAIIAFTLAITVTALRDHDSRAIINTAMEVPAQ